MNDLQRLVAIEDIRQLKARYWQGVDMKDKAMILSVFTDDAIIDYRAESYPPDKIPATTPPPDIFAQRCLDVLANFTTAHHGHNPQIRVLGDTDAEGIWPMEDNLWAKDSSVTGFSHMQGHGFYHDRYRKLDGHWLISFTTLTRLNVTRR